MLGAMSQWSLFDDDADDDDDDGDDDDDDATRWAAARPAENLSKVATFW